MCIHPTLIDIVHQRWVGIAAITVYAPTIFAQAGYGARKSEWLSGLNDVSDIFVSDINIALHTCLSLTDYLHAQHAPCRCDCRSLGTTCWTLVGCRWPGRRTIPCRCIRSFAQGPPRQSLAIWRGLRILHFRLRSQFICSINILKKSQMTVR